MHSRGRKRLHGHLRACNARDACPRANPAHTHPPCTGAARKLRWGQRGGGFKSRRRLCFVCGGASLRAAGVHAGLQTLRGVGDKGKWMVDIKYANRRKIALRLKWRYARPTVPFPTHNIWVDCRFSLATPFSQLVSHPFWQISTAQYQS